MNKPVGIVGVVTFSSVPGGGFSESFSAFHIALKPCLVVDKSDRKPIQRKLPVEVMVAGLLVPQNFPIIGLLEVEPSLIIT